MNTLQGKINFLIGGLVIVCGSLGYISYKSYYQQSTLAKQIVLSTSGIDFADDALKKNFSKKNLRELQWIRKRIEGKERQDRFSELVSFYAARNYPAARRQLRLVRFKEAYYRQNSQPQMAYHRQRAEYFALIAVFILTVGFISLVILLQRGFFTPVQMLSQRMTDFLNHKYTYQFALPRRDELGHLHATFNSMAQQVLAQMEELKALDKAKSDFLSIASHELRTPLTSIKGSLNLLGTGVVGEFNETAENLLNIAEAETNRLIRLINDLLDLAKIEAGRFPLTKNWVPVETLVNQCFESLIGLSNSAQVSLTHEHTENLMINVDADRIQQVLTNLLSNAIKYSPENGIVTVHCGEDEQHNLRISVTDQGQGISPEDQEIVFQKFRQVTNSETPLVKGTGLGLAIARGLVEEHGGLIGLNSVPHRGSTFYFSLPEWKLAKTTPTVQEEAA